MKFEEIIKTISSTIAGIVLFFIAAGIYLSLKGFTLGSDGFPVLINSAQAADPSPNINFPKNHIMGDPKAPVTIYEYSSFGCYHCAKFHKDELPKLKKEYIDTGKVNLIYADLPLETRSQMASQISRCMPKDKYYPFIDTLFAKQYSWTRSENTKAALTQLAVQNGLTTSKVEECLKDQKTTSELADIRRQAIDSLELTGTPSFVIKTKDGYEVLHGSQSFQNFQKIIDKLTTK